MFGSKLELIEVRPVNSNISNRGKKIKVFICGDYEFETWSYGISAASGTSYPIAMTILSYNKNN